MKKKMHNNEVEKYLYVVDRFPHQYVIGFDRMRSSGAKVIMESLHIKENDWDFTIDAGGPDIDPFRLVLHFKHEKDRTLFALKVGA